MTTHNVLMLAGWVFLVASWIVPTLMKKELTDRSFWGAVLSAFACGIFVSGLIVQLMS